MKIYLDEDMRCHLEDDGSRREIESGDFDGKCKAYIEGYRFIPEGESWQREDGERFQGEAFFPWREHGLLEEFQSQYEESQRQAEDMSAALEAIYSGVTE